jgi:hypothetical protein
MGTHLAERDQRRHDEYMKAELASLREQLRLTQDRLNDVAVRLDAAERLILKESAK